MSRIFGFIGNAILTVFLTIGKAIGWLLSTIGSLIARSRIALAVITVILVLGVGGLVDLGLNWGRAYAGVHIGEIDVAGKTADEMRVMVEQTYAGRLTQGKVDIFANDQAEKHVADVVAQAEDAALAEQLSLEEARANKQVWTADAHSLGATLPIDDLVNEALAMGRENGGLFTRIGSLFGGSRVEMRASYSPEWFEQLAADIDATIGRPRVDFNIAVSEGVALVTEGNDGEMIDREKFSRELDHVFFGSPNGQGSFVARAEYAPLRIDRAAAEQVSNQVNVAISKGARFIYSDAYWDASSSVVGSWITTRIEPDGSQWRLSAFVDESKAKPSILTHLQESRSGDAVHISFEKNDGSIMVRTDGTGEIPLVSQAVQAFDNTLFGSQGKASAVSGEGVNSQQAQDSAASVQHAADQAIEVSIPSGPAPVLTSFDEALDLGLVSEISSFTTEYTNGSGTENRNFNIHLVSDLLSDSIVKPNEKWSFNGTAGECNAERGFLGAGAIIDGEYGDAVGGGICQVATTVFNAIYESGFPVVTRHNHSLYIASYPAGRDAAVSWPDLDLVWSNDSASDVLLKASYTDSSVTITLYGIDPDYRVSSKVGEWTAGEEHKTKTVKDDSLAAGRTYVKTAGTDGKKITVIRTVTSPEGAVLREDAFYSTYDPITEVVVAGPEVKEQSTNGSTSTGAAA